VNAEFEHRSAVTPESAIPESESPESEGATPEKEPEATESGGGGRAPFARRLDDPQRIDGGGRWSVDSTRRRCCRCESVLADQHVFHSVLEPPPPDLPDDDQELFARRDYCESCFSTDPPQHIFAHWRAVLPPPPGGVRKIVNLASLLAHFHGLVETPGRSDSKDEKGPEEAAASVAADPVAAERVSVGRGLSPARLRLAYLLSLFLVRRRMLKWEGLEGGILSLRCKESDRTLELSVPDLEPLELEEAIAEFEGLFR
jgi:hypothetical protein